MLKPMYPQFFTIWGSKIISGLPTFFFGVFFFVFLALEEFAVFLLGFLSGDFCGVFEVIQILC